MTWRPSPRRRARGGRANSSLDDAGSAGAAWPWPDTVLTVRVQPVVHVAFVTKTARAVLAAQLEPRDRTTRTSRGTSSCTSAVSVRPEAELPSRSRLRRLVRGRARAGSRARRATFFLFLASTVGAHSRSRNSSARAPFTPSPRARAPVPTPLESLACVAVRVRARGAARVAARRSASPFEW